MFKEQLSNKNANFLKENRKKSSLECLNKCIKKSLFIMPAPCLKALWHQITFRNFEHDKMKTIASKINFSMRIFPTLYSIKLPKMTFNTLFFNLHDDI